MPQGKGTYGSKVGRPPKKKEGIIESNEKATILTKEAFKKRKKKAAKKKYDKIRSKYPVTGTGHFSKEELAGILSGAIPNVGLAKTAYDKYREHSKSDLEKAEDKAMKKAEMKQQGGVVEPEEYKKGGKVGYFSKEARAKRKEKRQEKRNLRKINKKVSKLAKKDTKAAMDFVDVPSNVDPKKISATGRIRKKGLKGVKMTEGGAYAKYKKDSGAAKSFREAFASARKAGDKTFTWDGRSYAAVTKEDVAKKKADKAASDAKLKTAEDAATKKAMAPAPKPKVDKPDTKVDKPDTKVVEKPDTTSAPTDTSKVDSSAGPKDKITGIDLNPDDTNILTVDKRKALGMSQGGEVKSSNPYGWPSTDARGRKD